jgi:hypothetical protein
MVVYNVTVNVEKEVESDWVQWMRDIHIPDVLATGLFLNGRFCRLLFEEETGVTYTIQYALKDMEALKLYQQMYAPALQKAHHERYQGKYVAFRSLMEIVDEFSSRP